MEGKAIIKVVELGQGYQLVKFDDGEIGFLQVITPDGLNEDLLELLEEEPEKQATSKPDKKPAKKEKEPKEEPEPDGEAYVWADLEAMDHAALKELCDENDLKTDPDDYDDGELDEFRKEVAAEIDIEVPAEEPAESDKGEGKTKDDEYTWDDLKDMDFDELTDLCDEDDLATDPNDYDEEDEDKLRRAIAKDLGITPRPKKK